MNDDNPLSNFVERRKRCRAVQFLRVDQVEFVAGELYAVSYTLLQAHGDGDQSPQLDLVIKTSAGKEITVHKGDYLKYEDWCFPPIVVPRAEFQTEFEPEPKSEQ